SILLIFAWPQGMSRVLNQLSRVLYSILSKVVGWLFKTLFLRMNADVLISKLK
ncbi:hypothetical protein MKX01_026612, partial [Papaver californicum]